MSKEIGKCLCGNIEVECDELPKVSVACYCEDCQKASGGGASYNIVIPDDDIRILKGIPSIYNVLAESGNKVERLFCSDCGSAICSKLISRTVWKAGLFSHLKDIQVSTNVWASRANKLCKVDTDKTTFEEAS